MIAVVMDPFAEQLVHPERAHERVDPDPVHVGNAQAPDQRHAVLSEGCEFRGKCRARAEVIAPRRGHGRWIPSLEVGRDVGAVGRQDPPDSAGKPAPLGLDQVADALVGAPLARFRAPATVGPKRAELGDDRRGGGRQEIRDAAPAGRARPAGCACRVRSSAARPLTRRPRQARPRARARTPA